MDFSQETVIRNIAKIRNNKGFTKRKMSELLSMDESNYGRLESGKAELSYRRLVEIASILQTSVVNILTFPIKYGPMSEDIDNSEPLEAILQIKLKKDKRDQVLNLIFGDNNLEVLVK